MTTAYAFRQYNLSVSLRKFLSEETGFQVDLIYDGYEYPDVRPLITVEQMQENREYNVKRREAVEVVYRWQIGLHAGSPLERMQEQEVIADLLSFKRVPYFNFKKSTENPVGFFRVELSAVVPMPSENIAKHSNRHTVYFDVELKTIKRSC